MSYITHPDLPPPPEPIVSDAYRDAVWPQRDLAEVNFANRLIATLELIIAMGSLFAQQLCGDGRPGGATSNIDTKRLFRMERGLVWAKALMDVFTGRTRFSTPPARVVIPHTEPRPVSTPRTPPAPPARTPLGVDKRAIWSAFTTRSIREIMVRICTDLGIHPKSDLWPGEFMQMHQTPAEWSAWAVDNVLPPEPQTGPASISPDAPAPRAPANDTPASPAAWVQNPSPPISTAHDPP